MCCKIASDDWTYRSTFFIPLSALPHSEHIGNNCGVALRGAGFLRNSSPTPLIDGANYTRDADASGESEGVLTNQVGCMVMHDSVEMLTSPMQSFTQASTRL